MPSRVESDFLTLLGSVFREQVNPTDAAVCDVAEKLGIPNAVDSKTFQATNRSTTKRELGFDRE
ncbi:hypothetical protein OAE79_00195 [Rhodopirellula sp.]|nr:hypothetical protein [Rhodopirellula sp.]MDC0295434.1 hypothetical protein [bacterium]